MGNNISTIAKQYEVVAILPHSWGHKRVNDVLERLYKECMLTVLEKATWRNSESGTYKVQCMSYIHGVPAINHYYSIGHEPVLVAHQAKNVFIKDQNNISWEEHSVRHYPWMCEFANQNDCPLKDKDPHIRKIQYTV